MATIFYILMWLTGCGVPVLLAFFIYKFFRGFLRLREGVSILKMREFFKSVIPFFLLLVLIPIFSDVGMLLLLKKVNSKYDLVIVDDIGVGLSSKEISEILPDSYQFKYESGHHPIRDKYVDFFFEKYSDFDFRINPDNRDKDMYWISVDSLLGYRSIGFMRL